MRNKDNISITPILYSRKDKAGKHPIKIRITANRKSKFEPIGFSIRKSEWSNYRRRVKSIHPEHELINFEIEQFVKRIEKYSKEGKIVNRFNQSSFIDYIEKLIGQWDKANKYHSRKRYRTLLKHLISFWGNENLNFYDLNPDFITEFKIYLETNIKPQGINEKPSDNTINGYLKALKAIITRSIEEGVYYGENPFRKGHIPKKHRTPKIVLSRDEIWFLNNIHQDMEGMTRLMWDSMNVFLFSFWSQGIRISDILQLKYKNFFDGYFVIKMEKTERKLTFPLTEDNLFRIIGYIDCLPTFFDWKEKVFWSTDISDVKKSRFKGIGDTPFELTPELELLGAHTAFQKNRFFLYDILKLSLSSENKKRHSDNRVDLYLDEKYKLHERKFYNLMKLNGGEIEQHNFKLFEESKSLFLKLGLKYFVKYSSDPKNKEKFIFPFLRGLEMDNGEKRWNRITSSTALINKNLGYISNKYGVRKFSSHIARHTFTTLSKELGVDIYELKQWLGHTNIKITEAYIQSINTESIKKQYEKIKGYLDD